MYRATKGFLQGRHALWFGIAVYATILPSAFHRRSTATNADPYLDPDIYIPDEATMARHKEERDIRELEGIKKALVEVEPPVLTDYKGEPIPTPPPLLPGEDMSKFFIPRQGSVAELMLTKGAPKEESKWACHNVWKPGALTLIVGTQQSFKSWSMFDLMYHAAKGMDWLDHDLGAFDHIIYVSNEKSYEAIYERLWLLFSEDMQAADKVYVKHRGDRIQFGNEAWLRFVEWVHGELCGRVLIILDTLTSLAPAGYDENNLKDVSRVLQAIRDLQDDSRIDVMLVHHLNAMGERPRGHTALDGEVDGFVKFDRRGRDLDEVLVKFEPKDGLPTMGTFTFNAMKGMFKRASSRALHVGNLTNIIQWWQERNGGEGMTLKDLRDRFFNGYRYDQVEKEVMRGVEELALKREKRRSLLTNREAELITVMSVEEREETLRLRRKVTGIEVEAEVRTAAELKSRDVLDRRASRAIASMPDPLWEGLG
jgi:RecA-family ATPase